MDLRYTGGSSRLVLYRFLARHIKSATPETAIAQREERPDTGCNSDALFVLEQISGGNRANWYVRVCHAKRNNDSHIKKSVGTIRSPDGAIVNVRATYNVAPTTDFITVSYCFVGTT